jgi:hypothetical protein
VAGSNAMDHAIRTDMAKRWNDFGRLACAHYPDE